MAFATIPGLGFWLPTKGDEASTIGTNVYIMDASGEKVCVVFMAPKTGTLTRFECYIAAVGNSPNNGLKCSFQSVSTTDGQVTGTILGAGAGAHVTSAVNTPASPQWFNPGDFGATVSVTAGDVLACVIEFGGAGFVNPDSVTVGHLTRCGDLALPYGISATSSKQAGHLPIFALRYNDGTYAMIDDEIWPAQGTADFDIDTGTAFNECGLRFTVPVELKLRAVDVFTSHAAANSSYEVYLYNAAGTNVLPSAITIDPDISSNPLVGAWHLIPLVGDIILAANTEYIFGFKPTTTVNLRVTYYTMNSSALMDAIPGGSEWYAVARAWSGGNPGAWTRYNNGTDGYRRPRVLLGLNGAPSSARARMQAAY